MFIDKKHLDGWFEKVMERFDRLENRQGKPIDRERPAFEGELLLDNQDLCLMLHVSNRTLQRYRTLGWLPYRKIDQKVYYLQSEVERFVRERFEQRRKKN